VSSHPQYYKSGYLTKLRHVFGSALRHAKAAAAKLIPCVFDVSLSYWRSITSVWLCTTWSLTMYITAGLDLGKNDNVAALVNSDS
jgi:hypothetical protein